MAESPAGEKTEKPTAKRLSEAAKNGDILQSRELATAMVVMAGIVWIAISGPAIMEALGHMLIRALRFDRGDLIDFAPADRMADLVSGLAIPVGGVLAICFLATIATPALLGSLGFRTDAIKFKPNKLNPATGLARIFSMNGVIELVKSLAKVLLMGAIGFWIIWDRLTVIIQMGKTGLEPALAELGSIFILACLAMGGALFLIAGIDVPAQIMQRAKRLGMTKQEVKDEHKEQEGSPEMKGRIRSKQFEMMRGGARKALADANVVITNPTHFSVALRYQPGRDQAPIVVARGRGDTALAIREIAQEMSLPVLQYPELARAIYYTSRAGMAVEERLYMAVAAVLAFVFRIDAKLATEMDRPHIDVPDDLRYDTDGRKL